MDEHHIHGLHESSELLLPKDFTTRKHLSIADHFKKHCRRAVLTIHTLLTMSLIALVTILILTEEKCSQITKSENEPRPFVTPGEWLWFRAYVGKG